MTSLRRRPRHALVVAAALVALLTAAGCGRGRTPTGEQAATGATFDQALHDRLPAAVRERGTVRVGGSDPYPPAAFYAPDGRTFVGFEPDLAAEMGRVLGVRFEFVNLSFSDLLPQLRRHKIDVVMAYKVEGFAIEPRCRPYLPQQPSPLSGGDVGAGGLPYDEAAVPAYHRRSISLMRLTPASTGRPPPSCAGAA